MQEKITHEIKEIKKDLEEYTKIYIDSTKLHIAGELSRLHSGMMLKLHMLYLLLFVLLFFSTSAALFIGEAIESYAIGFAIMGGFYVVIVVFVWLFRDLLFERPAVQSFIKLMFPNNNNDE